MFKNLFSKKPADFGEKTAKAYDQYWRKVGALAPDVIAHMISPQLRGGAAWPTTRQAVAMIRREKSIILATSGLSDIVQLEGKNVNGIGVELFIEANHASFDHTAQSDDVMEFANSWQYLLLKAVADSIGQHWTISNVLETHKVLSMEIPGVNENEIATQNIPPEYFSSDGAIGVLIGQPLADFPSQITDMPCSQVNAVPITLITAAETDAVIAGGATARKSLAQLLAGGGFRNLVDFDRPDLSGLI